MNELSVRVAQFKIKMEQIKYDACQKLDDLKKDLSKLTPLEVKYRGGAGNPNFFLNCKYSDLGDGFRFVSFDGLGG